MSLEERLYTQVREGERLMYRHEIAQYDPPWDMLAQIEGLLAQDPTPKTAELWARARLVWGMIMAMRCRTILGANPRAAFDAADTFDLPLPQAAPANLTQHTQRLLAAAKFNNALICTIMVHHVQQRYRLGLMDRAQAATKAALEMFRLLPRESRMQHWETVARLMMAAQHDWLGDSHDQVMLHAQFAHENLEHANTALRVLADHLRGTGDGFLPRTGWWRLSPWRPHARLGVCHLYPYK